MRINPRLGKQRLGDRNEITPPIFFCAMLGPSRAWHDHLMSERGLRQNLTDLIGQNTFCLIGANVYAKKHGHRPSPPLIAVEIEIWANLRKPCFKKLRKISQITECANLETGMGVATREAQIDCGNTLPHLLDIG